MIELMTDKTENNEFPEALFGDEARNALLAGVEIIAAAVTSTLGPKGKNVIVDRGKKDYIITKDGVTVAKMVNLKDPYKQMGVQVLREAAQRTNDVAGDGTTTSTCLAHALFAAGMVKLKDGHSAIEIKRGIDKAVPIVIEELRRLSSPVNHDDMIVNVASISANGEREIGELIREAMTAVGRDGVITVESARGFKTTLEIVEGAKYDRGYTSPYFITNTNKMICELENPVILLSNMRFSNASDIIPLLQEINTQKRSALIVADEVEGELLQLLITNHMRENLKCCIIKAPEYGDSRLDLLNDMATLLGGRLLTSGDKLNSRNDALTFLNEMAGSCKKVIIDKAGATFIGCAGNKEAIIDRADDIRLKLSDHTIETVERTHLQNRLAKLAGGVAIIHVGGPTEVEMMERKYRVEDALNATQAAIKEGIVPGGGSALFKAASKISEENLKNIDNFADLSDDEKEGFKIVHLACYAPFRMIMRNAGKVNLDEIEAKLVLDNDSSVYDITTDQLVNANTSGIIDPVMVTRIALENASSVAGLLLTVDVCLLDSTRDEQFGGF